jgi:hypothetical protein
MATSSAMGHSAKETAAAPRVLPTTRIRQASNGQS